MKEEIFLVSRKVFVGEKKIFGWGGEEIWWRELRKVKPYCWRRKNGGKEEFFGETGVSKVLQLSKRSSRIIIPSINIFSNDTEEEALIMNMNKFCHRLSARSESQLIESWRQSRGKDFRFLLLVCWVNKIRWRRTNSN